MRATLRSESCQSLKDGVGEVLNTRVDILAVVQLWDQRNFVLQVGLEVGPISAPDNRSIRWMLEG
jgi:hypothetical protein